MLLLLLLMLLPLAYACARALISLSLLHLVSGIVKKLVGTETTEKNGNQNTI